jgi:PAS domain S-box-containing protein
MAKFEPLKPGPPNLDTAEGSPVANISASSADYPVQLVHSGFRALAGMRRGDQSLDTMSMPEHRSASLARSDDPITLRTALRYSEERFRLLVEGLRDYAIFILDAEGRVSSWNVGAERIKGYVASEIIGSHISRFYSQEDILSGKPAQELGMAVRDGRVEDEGWRLRKDGSKFWANVVITALKDDEGNLLGFAKVTRDFTERMRAHEELRRANEELGKEVVERKNAERKLQESEQSLRYLSRHLLRSQDEERKRIGRELHDSVGQYLAVLKMTLDSLKPPPGSAGEQVARHLAQCSELANDCIKEVRTIAYLLYPPMLEEMGLRSAIAWYLEGFTQRSGINATLDVSPDLTRLPRDVELAVFRVLQESLTNVHRHSGSPTVHVRVVMNDGAVSLEVRDQGKGVLSGVLEESNYESLAALGVGLRGMNERTRQLGGSLELSSSEQGTTVRAKIPCVDLPSVPNRAAGAAAGASSPHAKTDGDRK